MKLNKPTDPLPPAYIKLMDLLSLENIIMPKQDFALAEDCAEAKKHYEIEFSKHPGNVETTSTNLNLRLGYKASCLCGQQEVFTANFHYFVVFSHSNEQGIRALLEDEDVRKILTGIQGDKLIWPYLRRSLLQVLVDAGLPPMVLPALK